VTSVKVGWTERVGAPETEVDAFPLGPEQTQVWYWSDWW
jgi:hypothetical protein